MRRTVVAMLAFAALVTIFSAWLAWAIPEAMSDGKASRKRARPPSPSPAPTSAPVVASDLAAVAVAGSAAPEASGAHVASASVASGRGERTDAASIGSRTVVRRKLLVRGRALDEDGKPLAGTRLTLAGRRTVREAQRGLREEQVIELAGRMPLERRAELLDAIEEGHAVVDLGSAVADGAGMFSIEASGEVDEDARFHLTALWERGRERAAGYEVFPFPEVGPLEAATVERDVNMWPLSTLVIHVSSRGAPVPEAAVLIRTGWPIHRYGRFGGSSRFGGWTTRLSVTEKPEDAIGKAMASKCLSLLATTDAAGEAELTCDASWAILSVARAGYATEHASADPRAGRVEVELAPESLVEGAVVDPSGRGVAGATVRAFEASGVGRSEEASSGADGRFALHDVRAGRDYVLWAELPGGESLLPGRVAATAPAADVRVVLVAEARLLIQFVLAAGEPSGPEAPYFSPRFQLERRSRAGTWEVAASGEGPFSRGPSVTPCSLSGLRPGTCRLRLGGNGVAPMLAAPFEVAAGGPWAPLVVELRRSRTVVGRVRSPSGAPIEAEVVAPSWRGDSARTYAGPDGRFALENQGWDELPLEVKASGWKSARVVVPPRELDAGDVVLERDVR